MVFCDASMRQCGYPVETCIGLECKRAPQNQLRKFSLPPRSAEIALFDDGQLLSVPSSCLTISTEVVPGGFFRLTAPHDMTKPLTESGLTSYGLFYHHVMNSWIVDGWLYYIHDNHRITDVVCKDSWIPPAASLREVEAQVTLTSACGRPSWIVVTFPCEEMMQEKSKRNIWQLPLDFRIFLEDWLPGLANTHFVFLESHEFGMAGDCQRLKPHGLCVGASCSVKTWKFTATTATWLGDT